MDPHLRGGDVNIMSVLIKICGISDSETLAHAVGAGANFVGFVHFKKSPRHVEISTLISLIKVTPAQSKSVAVLVNPTDELLDKLFANARPDYVQLHGDESTERVLEIKTKYNTKIIKAIAVSNAEDVASAHAFEGIADIILFDAKAPKDSDNAGGFGVSFDWNLLSSSPHRGEVGRGVLLDSASPSPLPNPPPQGEGGFWMLSGGLTPENVAQALAITNAPMVDVSSHVETPPGSGKKNPQKISEFIKASQGR